LVLARSADGLSPNTLIGYEHTLGRVIEILDDPAIEVFTTDGLRRDVPHVGRRP
jgi:hypothetical protein